MRNLLGFAVLCIVTMGFACNAAKKTVETTVTAEVVPATQMTFTPKYYDLGVVKKGEIKELLFPFTNTGTENIVIEIASGCTCSKITAPEGKSIPPGGKDVIKVIYDSNLEEELGAHNKVVDILLLNTDPKNGYPIVEEVKYDLVLEE